MRALVTGITGFVGHHLASALLSAGVEVVGVGLECGSAGTGTAEAVVIREVDICNPEAVRSVLREYRPDYVYHLAALSNVALSFQNPELTYKVNVVGTLNLYEQLRQLELRPRVVHISTANLYSSPVQGSRGIDEAAPVSLLTPYATSKFMGEALASHYAAAFGIQSMIVRPFNHIGPGQAPEFVCSDFARQIIRMKAGEIPPVLHTGNLEAERDFTDVRDVVAAYCLIAERGRPGEIYNVASGTCHRMREIVSLLAELAGIQVTVETDQSRVRPMEVQRLCGDASRLCALGWQPRISLKQSLQDILDDWKERQWQTDKHRQNKEMNSVV